MISNIVGFSACFGVTKSLVIPGEVVLKTNSPSADLSSTTFMIDSPSINLISNGEVRKGTIVPAPLIGVREIVTESPIFTFPGTFPNVTS